MPRKTPRSRGSCRRYVLYVNKGYRRSGTRFGGRHKASLVAADDYPVAGYRHIALNPVAAGRVQSPEPYRWSLPSPCLGQSQQLDPGHDRYLALDRDPAARRYAHRELFKHQLPEA